MMVETIVNYLETKELAVKVEEQPPQYPEGTYIGVSGDQETINETAMRFLTERGKEWLCEMSLNSDARIRRYWEWIDGTYHIHYVELDLGSKPILLGMGDQPSLEKIEYLPIEEESLN